MDRCVEINIGGKDYPLLMSLAAEEKICQKYGSMKCFLEKFSNEKESVTTYIDVLQLMIEQGCAYKNTFEKDVPPGQNAPVREGKFCAISREEIALGLDRRRLGEIINKILEAAGLARKNEIAGKEIGNKKNESKE